MSISNDRYKEYKVMCDNCGEESEIFDNWDNAVDWENDNFRKIKINKEWFSCCPECINEFKRRK